MRFDLIEYFFPKLSQARIKGTELIALCPLHPDSSPSFSINIDTGKWICRSASCGKRGSLVSLIAQINNISYKQAAQIAQVREPLYSQNEFDELLHGKPKVLQPTVYPVLPKCVNAKEFYPEYLIKRRYDKQSNVAEFWDLKLGVRGCPVYGNRFADYLILPLYDKNKKYLSFTARYIGLDKDKLRYDGPPGSLKDYLYGEWLLSNETKPVFIVEGQFDVLRMWTFGEDALGTFGTSYTHKQVLRICTLVGERPVVICYDKDTMVHNNIMGSDTHSIPQELVSMLYSVGKNPFILDIGLVPGVKDIDDLNIDLWMPLKATLSFDSVR